MKSEVEDLRLSLSQMKNLEEINLMYKAKVEKYKAERSYEEELRAENEEMEEMLRKANFELERLKGTDNALASIREEATSERKERVKSELQLQRKYQEIAEQQSEIARYKNSLEKCMEKVNS